MATRCRVGESLSRLPAGRGGQGSDVIIAWRGDDTGQVPSVQLMGRTPGAGRRGSGIEIGAITLEQLLAFIAGA